MLINHVVKAVLIQAIGLFLALSAVAQAGRVSLECSETASTNNDCTPSRCGDEKLNRAAGEMCDEGHLNGIEGHCSFDCAQTPAYRQAVAEAAQLIEELEQNAATTYDSKRSSAIEVLTNMGLIAAAVIFACKGVNFVEVQDPFHARQAPIRMTAYALRTAWWGFVATFEFIFGR